MTVDWKATVERMKWLYLLPCFLITLATTIYVAFMKHNEAEAPIFSAAIVSLCVASMGWIFRTADGNIALRWSVFGLSLAPIGLSLYIFLLSLTRFDSDFTIGILAASSFLFSLASAILYLMSVLDIAQDHLLTWLASSFELCGSIILLAISKQAVVVSTDGIGISSYCAGAVAMVVSSLSFAMNVQIPDDDEDPDDSDIIGFSIAIFTASSVLLAMQGSVQCYSVLMEKSPLTICTVQQWTHVLRMISAGIMIVLASDVMRYIVNKKMEEKIASSCVV